MLLPLPSLDISRAPQRHPLTLTLHKIWYRRDLFDNLQRRTQKNQKENKIGGDLNAGLADYAMRSYVHDCGG